MRDTERLFQLVLGLSAVNLEHPGATAVIGGLYEQLIDTYSRLDRNVDDMERVLDHITKDPVLRRHKPSFASETDAVLFRAALTRYTEGRLRPGLSTGEA